MAKKTEELDSVEKANKAFGEELAGTGPTDGFVVKDVERKKGESQQAYNERIPPALQPAAKGPTHSYLGQKL